MQVYVGAPRAMVAVDVGWTVFGVDNFEANLTQVNGESSSVDGVAHTQL